MADDIRADICGANRYNPIIWPCSSPVLNDIGSFIGWPSMDDMVDLKSIRSCDGDDPAGFVSVDDISFSSSMVTFQDIQKSPPNQLLMDSKSLQGFSVSSPMATSDWNQILLHDNERNIERSGYPSLMQEEMISRMNYIREEMGATQEEMTISNSSNGCKTLFESSDTSPQPYPSLFDTGMSSNYQSPSSFMIDSDELFSPSTWSKFSPFTKPSLPKQQPVNNTSFWNASTNNGIMTSCLPSANSEVLVPIFEGKSNSVKPNNEKVGDSASLDKKTTSEPAFKRPRIETPSPLPTFKVRKEKLGDRITALQQLVSPFGKTDTASVLHEAVGYIRFLHNQVNVLSTPYMKNGTTNDQVQQSLERLKDDKERPKRDLRSLGLCLVPISSTFPVAHETTADLWTPSFGGAFR